MDLSFEQCLEEGKKLESAGADPETLLLFFRKHGANMPDSVKLIRQVKGLSLREAQEVVHHSDTWADGREAQERLQDAFWEALEELQDDSRPKS